MYSKRNFKYFESARNRIGLLGMIAWYFTPTRIALDFGYRRSDFTTIVYFKEFRGKIYIVREVKG